MLGDAPTSIQTTNSDSTQELNSYLQNLQNASKVTNYAEKDMVFYVKSGEEFRSVDVKLQAVRAGSSASLCEQIYADTVRQLVDAL